MPGLHPLSTFLSDESGVVTIDWVVLCAALLALALATVNMVGTAMEELALEIEQKLEEDHLRRSFAPVNQDDIDG